MQHRNIRILVVSASPRKYGAIAFAQELIVRLCKEVENVDVDAVNVYDYNIQPCIGCVSDNVKMCKIPCVINDDMSELYERVISSDGIIFVTPIYWYNVPGPLKNFIDRLTLLENAIFTEGRSKAEGKVTGFVVIGNDTGAIAVIQNLMAVLNSFGTIIPPWALAYHTLESHPIENDKFLLDLANVVRCVILMVRLVKEGIKIDYWYRADEEYKNLVKSLAGKVLAEIQKTIL